MKRTIAIVLSLSLVLIVIISALSQKRYEEPLLMKLKEKYSRREKPLVDHSRFAALNKKFNRPQEITAACLSCHNLTASDVMNTNHWNWDREEYLPGRGVVYLGKRNAINNFCIATKGNEKACAKCHIRLGIDDQGNLYSDSLSIDCLVCHEQTETYVKGKNLGGAPAPGLNLTEIARHVGRPKRSNCGVCHFYGGGGNNVKHGDMEMALFEPTREVDVHMAVDGPNLQCVDCHQTSHHMTSGRLYSLSSMDVNRTKCEQCHSETPHKEGILNEHTLKVACQTCHIPIYAKVNATKVFWDWSTAGRLKNGKPYSKEDSLGNHTYLSIKGSFIWKRRIKPDYVWFNGYASIYLKGDIIEDTTKPVLINRLFGSYQDENSKIVPVKIQRTIQPYDPINRILITPKLYADKKGEGAFWKDFDWIKAAEVGMKDSGLPFSGKVAFIKTLMYWPLNHMVSPKEEAVKCQECHTRTGSRLASLTDFYLPGRDYSKIIDTGGQWLIILTMLGVIFHGGLRIWFYTRSKSEKKEVKND